MNKRQTERSDARDSISTAVFQQGRAALASYAKNVTENVTALALQDLSR
jgi:hypothetical protein